MLVVFPVSEPFVCVLRGGFLGKGGWEGDSLVRQLGRASPLPSRGSLVLLSLTIHTLNCEQGWGPASGCSVGGADQGITLRHL